MVLTGRKIKRGTASFASTTRLCRVVVCGGVAALVLLGAQSSVWAADAGRLAPDAVGTISFAAQATPLTLGLGSGFTDTATLTAPPGGPAPTGSVSFSVYGPSDPTCAGPILFNSTDTIGATPTPSGAYTTTSGGLTPANVGTYRVTAKYTGDANYASVETACGDPANSVVVGQRPTLSAVSPNSGPVGGTNTVTITGANLSGASTVDFGSVQTAATVISATEVIATAPAGSGTVDVTVVTPFGTTATGPADLYTYVSGIPSGIPTGPTPVTVGAQAPVVVTGAATKVTSSSAEFTGTVDPVGMATSIRFEYTVRLPGGVTLTGRTPAVPIGVLRQSVTAEVSGLLAASRYRVRLEATSAAGTTIGGATSFVTPGDPPPPPPVLGSFLTAAPVSGVVYVRLPGSGEPVRPLTDALQLPVGTNFDTRHGVVRLTAATGSGGRTRSGDFSTGRFTALQQRAAGGAVMLELLRPSTARATCAGAGHAADVLAGLHASLAGGFEIRGRYASATGATGASWTTTDRCDGTLTAASRGTTTVDDLRRGRTIVLGAGHTYLVKAP
jgi:IPT/TIG domain-containing protein